MAFRKVFSGKIHLKILDIFRCGFRKPDKKFKIKSQGNFAHFLFKLPSLSLCASLTIAQVHHLG